MATARTTCPITRNQFSKASNVAAVIAGTTLSAAPRTFSTGSMGFFGNGKVTVIIDGKPCLCQVSLTVTVVGSKELPAATEAAAQ